MLAAGFLGHSHSPFPEDACSQGLPLMGSRLLMSGQDFVRPRHHWNSCGELTHFRTERGATVDFLDRQESEGPAEVVCL